MFGFDRRTQRLLEDLSHRWRHLGPIRLIGGPDVAYVTIEPYEFFEFLNGRLSRDFIRDRNDLESRLAANRAVPDPDGLFRIEDFFCHEDTWRMVISRLAREADAVFMDLRGFTSANRGCVFEVEHLVASIPVHRIVLLVDDSTDLCALRETVRHGWQIRSNEPPKGVAVSDRLCVLRASRRHGRTLDALLGLLCETFAEKTPA